MSAIRIDTLPVLSAPEERDLVNFQRLVDGVWTDYHTDFATIQGEVRTFIQPFDLAFDSQFTVYSPAADELVVPIAAWIVLDDDGNGVQLQVVVQDVGALSTAVLEGLINPLSAGQYAFQCIDGSGNFTGLDTDLMINLNVGVGPTASTGVAYVQYAVVPKL